MVDTGAIVALVDASDRHHRALRTVYETCGDEWVLPWALLPEVDHLLTRQVSALAAEAFRADLAAGAFTIEWGCDEDLVRTHALCAQHAALQLGLVDAAVLAVAARRRWAGVSTR
ncbi:PIN domain-containing protein [Gemmatimonas sp.]|uniref:PIN domain-containing protein n=1 Tax=Gemmatimonas sp. TaxID=1962908 RepID=UPI003983A033